MNKLDILNQVVIYKKSLVNLWSINKKNKHYTGVSLSGRQITRPPYSSLGQNDPITRPQCRHQNQKDLADLNVDADVDGIRGLSEAEDRRVDPRHLALVHIYHSLEKQQKIT